MNNPVFFDPDRLTFDAYSFLFSEWLSRQGIRQRFIKNRVRALKHKGSTDQLIRDYVRYLLVKPYYSMDLAMEAAFPFAETPEGFVFWKHASDEWSSFLSDFLRN